MEGSDGWAAGVCGAVRYGGAVYRALGRAAVARWVCLHRVRRAGGVAAEGAPARLRMHRLPPAGIGDGGDGVSSHAHRSLQVVSRRLPDGPRQARRRGQVSAAGAGGGVSDGLDHGAQAAPRAERGPNTSAARLARGGRDLHRRPRRPNQSRPQHEEPRKELVVAAVEKVPAPKNKKGKHGHSLKRQHGFFAGDARIAVLPAATGAELGAFLKANVAAHSHLLTDGFAGYRGRDADLGEHLKHTPVVQDEGANAGEFFPIIHTLFSNIKAWLVGTHHGVSAKHQPRYLREWSYRFNRRNLADGLDGYLIRRAIECATITYGQLTTGAMPAGANRTRRLPAGVAEPASAG